MRDQVTIPHDVGDRSLFVFGLASTLIAHLSDDVAAGRVVVRKEWIADMVNEIQKYNPDVIAVVADLKMCLTL